MLLCSERGGEVVWASSGRGMGVSITLIHTWGVGVTVGGSVLAGADHRALRGDEAFT